MAAKPEYVEFLRAVPQFAHLPAKSLKRVAQTATEVNHPQGHVVMKQGAGVHLLHVIVSGEAAVSVDGNHVAQLGPGDYFGEIALLAGGKRTATVTAATDLRVLAVDPASFRRLLRSDAELAASLPETVAARLEELDSRLPD